MQRGRSVDFWVELSKSGVLLARHRSFGDRLFGRDHILSPSSTNLDRGLAPSLVPVAFLYSRSEHSRSSAQYSEPPIHPLYDLPGMHSSSTPAVPSIAPSMPRCSLWRRASPPSALIGCRPGSESGPHGGKSCYRRTSGGQPDLEWYTLPSRSSSM